jgi:hypothetical protein
MTSTRQVLGMAEKLEGRRRAQQLDVEATPPSLQSEFLIPTKADIQSKALPDRSENIEVNLEYVI